MPSSWIIEMIKPIYKNKGDKFDLRNDRPITIVSCLGKFLLQLHVTMELERKRINIYF